MINFSSLKNLANLYKEAGKIDEYKQILELQAQLLEMQEANTSLKEENKQLENILSFKDTLTFDDNIYWNKQKEAFCSRCWDKDRVAIRLTRTNPTNDHYFTCPECKNRFTTKAGKIAQDRAYAEGI